MRHTTLALFTVHSKDINIYRGLPVRGTPYKPLRMLAHTCEHLHTAATISTKGTLCTNKVHFAPTIAKPSNTSSNPQPLSYLHPYSQHHCADCYCGWRICANQLCSYYDCGNDQGRLLTPIPTHGFIRTPITTHGLMRTPSLIDGKPPWMGTRPWM